jgi:1-phosphatidylinositol-4-phosphate 5-kinase
MLIEILPAYYQHVMQNPGTYLPRFYGLHRWKPEYGRNVRFVVMNNVFATNLAIHRRFDLKGSTMGRSASQADRAKGHRCILKDNDLVASGFKLKMGPARKRAFLDQVRCDCFFLMSLKIMDYSMLVGVHYRDEPLGATAEPTAASSNVVGTASTPQTSNKPPNTRLSAILLEPNPDAPPHVHPSQPASSAAHVDVADVSEAVGEATVGEEHPSMPALGANSSQLELTSRPINVPSNSGDHLSAIVAQELDGDPGHYNPSGIEGRLADGEAAGERYFLGVIDILMLYTRRKKLERVWKTFTDGEGASSQPPPDYASRFCKFLDSITE